MTDKEIERLLTRLEESSREQTRALESIAASILLHAQIQSGAMRAYDILSDAGSPFVALTKQAVRILQHSASGSKTEVHAYQLFEQNKPLSMPEIAQRFREADWTGLTSKGSATRLMEELTGEIDNRIDKIITGRPLSYRVFGETKVRARELSRYKITLRERLAATKDEDSYVPHNLLYLAAELGLRDHQLRRAVNPERVINPASRNEYGIYAGERCPVGIPVEQHIIIVIQEMLKLRKEITELKKQRNKKS